MAMNGDSENQKTFDSSTLHVFFMDIITDTNTDIDLHPFFSVLFLVKKPFFFSYVFHGVIK